MTPARQSFLHKTLRSVMRSSGCDAEHHVVDRDSESASRWESTWDGIHDSLLMNDVALKIIEEDIAAMGCRVAQKGGRNMCPHS